MSILCGFFIAVCMGRVFHSKPLSEEEQSDYLPLPRATSMALYLDPKSDFGEEEELDEDDEDLYPFSEEYEDEDED